MVDSGGCRGREPVVTLESDLLCVCGHPKSYHLPAVSMGQPGLICSGGNGRCKCPRFRLGLGQEATTREVTAAAVEPDAPHD